MMTALTKVDNLERLVLLVEDAAKILNNAHSAAEILDARDKASLAYDAAKRAARLAQARDAHNTLIAAAHRTQARALEIEAGAKRRLADEYDAAQERGEVRKQADNQAYSKTEKAGPSDLGLSAKEIHEARKIRDAEEADPGIIRRTLDEAVERGEEPTKAKIRRAINTKKMKRKRHVRPKINDPKESQHDRDLRMLMGVWDASCESARDEFLKAVIK